MDVRLGNGYDVHAFEAGDHVILCGVRIPHHAALKGILMRMSACMLSRMRFTAHWPKAILAVIFPQRSAMERGSKRYFPASCRGIGT